MAKRNRVLKIQRRAAKRRYKINNKGFAQRYADIIKKKEVKVRGKQN